VLGIGLDGPLVELLGTIRVLPDIRQEVGVVAEDASVLGISKSVNAIRFLGSVTFMGRHGSASP
jgi:hypothetical protein